MHNEDTWCEDAVKLRLVVDCGTAEIGACRVHGTRGVDGRCDAPRGKSDTHSNVTSPVSSNAMPSISITLLPHDHLLALPPL